MSEEFAKAKRRYKVLLREQERLQEKHAVDPQVNKEIERLRLAFPELDTAPTKLSQAAATLISSVDGELSSQNVADEKRGEATVSRIALQKRDDSTADGGARPPQPQQGNDESLERLLQIAVVCLPFAAFLRRAPRFALSLRLASAALAVLCSCLHRFAGLDPCTYGWWVDPLGLITIVHMLVFFVQRNDKRYFIIALLDTIPSIIIGFVSFSILTIAFNAAGVRRVPNFCL